MIASIRYSTSPKTPFWGKPTAQINFCEEDYIITSYIAEFANTLTNVSYIIYSLHGLNNLRLARRLTWSSALPLVGLIAVGLCSAAFHTTLLEVPQLADDLSMVFPTAFILLRLLSFEAPDLWTARRNTTALTVALLVIYTIHLNINKPLLHSSTWGIMIHFIRQKIWRLLSERVPDHRVRRKLRQTALVGAITFGFGYVLWLIDRFACDALTQAKRALGMPWGFLFEFHGWWHIFTAIGAYIFIILADHLTSEQLGNSSGDVFGWPAEQILRMYEERTTPLTNGSIVNKGMTHSNGTTEKPGKTHLNGSIDKEAKTHVNGSTAKGGKSH